MDPATRTVLYLRVVEATYESTMPEIVDMAPGGMAKSEVSKGLNPSPLMMRVLKVVKPPLGTYVL